MNYILKYSVLPRRSKLHRDSKKYDMDLSVFILLGIYNFETKPTVGIM